MRDPNQTRSSLFLAGYPVGPVSTVIYSITKVVQFKLARVPLFMYLHWLVMMQTKIPSQILEWLDSLV